MKTLLLSIMLLFVPIFTNQAYAQEKPDKLDLVLKQLGDISKNIQELQKEQKQIDGRLDNHQIRMDKSQVEMNKLKADFDNLRKTVEDMKKAPLILPSQPPIFPSIPPFSKKEDKKDDRPPIIEAKIEGPDGKVRILPPSNPTVPYYPPIEKITKAEAWFQVTNNWDQMVTIIVNDQPYEVTIGTTRRISVTPGKVTYRLLQEDRSILRETTIRDGATFKCSVDPNPAAVRQPTHTQQLYYQPGYNCSPGYYYYK
jgi:hypothetical protein